jgi:hypothetical protein
MCNVPRELPSDLGVLFVGNYDIDPSWEWTMTSRARAEVFLWCLIGSIGALFIWPNIGLVETSTRLPHALVPTTLLDFRPSTPVPTIVQIPLPDAQKNSVLFDFHPSAKQTALRVMGGNSTTKVVACAAGVPFEGSGSLVDVWGPYWHGCIDVPSNGALLPADNGQMQVAVRVRVTSSRRLIKARLMITYVPGDYHFSEVSMSPTPKTALFRVTTASPVLLGACVEARCGGHLTVAVDGKVVVDRSVRTGLLGTWVNELPVTGSAYTFSLAHSRCRAHGENVGLSIATGSPGGP